MKGPLFKKENLVIPGHYEFTLSVTKQGETVTVERRYSDFYKLREALECLYPGLFIPVLPPKGFIIAFEREDSESIQNRKRGIKHFILSIINHRELGSNE